MNTDTLRQSHLITLVHIDSNNLKSFPVCGVHTYRVTKLAVCCHAQTVNVEVNFSVFLKGAKRGRVLTLHPRHFFVCPCEGSMVQRQAPPGLPPSGRSCAGCGDEIADRFLLYSMERFWHTGCLRCSCCHAQLGDIGTTCYNKGGMILCRSDYIR